MAVSEQSLAPVLAAVWAFCRLFWVLLVGRESLGLAALGSLQVLMDE